ncbi:MAG: YihY/virulence factor BrkB family protein [Cyclobacteriaceae bacterium]
MTSKERIGRLRQFIEVDLWKVKTSTLPKSKAWFYRQLRIWIIAITEFKRDNITEKASALTYFSLLSIVPVMATAFGIAKGFGLEIYLERELGRFFSGQEVILETSLEYVDKMLAKADSGVIVGISFIFIIYAVIRLMNNIEMAFNEIWDTRSRSWQRKISDYLAIILLGPVFLIMSGTVSAFIAIQVRGMAKSIELFGYFEPIVLFGIKLIPYIIMSILMTLLYLIFPNTRVKFVPGIVAGIVVGTVFQLTQLAWINGQVYLLKSYVVYGSFAVLPLFMIYIQLSWMIVLFGGELAYSVQNANEWEYTSRKMKMSIDHKRKLTILVMYHLVKNFEMRGNRPLSISNLSGLVHVPLRFVKEVIRELEEAKLVNKISDDDTERFQPALDIAHIDIHMLVRKIEMTGYDDLMTEDDDKFKEIEKLLDQVSTESKASSANRHLKDL